MYHGSGGGADGSMLVFSDIETEYDANGGIDWIVSQQNQLLPSYNMTPGDLYAVASSLLILPNVYLAASSSQARSA
jgi:hypothetical protein